MRVVVFPAETAPSAEAYLKALGWGTWPQADAGVEIEAAAAVLDAGCRGQAVVYFPGGVVPIAAPKRIFVLHDGSPEAAPGVISADQVAVKTGAKIVVLHVPALEAAAGPGSLPAPRLVDHLPHDLAEWRHEFLRRFCGVSAGVSLRMEVATGSVSEALLVATTQDPDDLIIATWKCDTAPERAGTLRVILEAAPCPVLVIPEAANAGGSAIPLGRISGVIFDMDGVVTDTAKVHAAAWKRLFDEYLAKKALTTEAVVGFDEGHDYRAYVDGRNRYDGVKGFLHSRGITLPFGDPADPPGAETICGLGNLKDKYFLEHLASDGAVAYPSTLRLIAGLKSKAVPVAVVTASRNSAEVLRAAGIADLFDQTLDGVDAADLDLAGKPDPAMFLEAASRLGLAPPQVAVIEDAIAGVQAAVRGGFGLVVGVDRVGQTEALEAAGANLVVDDLSHLGLS